MLCLCAGAATARGDNSAWASPDSATPAAAPLNSVCDSAAAPPPQTALDALGSSALLLDDSEDDNAVYGPPPLSPEQQEGTNSGGVNLDLDIGYATDYVYRGVDHDDVGPSGNSLNLLIDSRLTFDFGPYPHLFVGVFADVYNADPVSQFQEFRPSVGADWNLRPFLLELGHNSYIYPQRENFDTSELYLKVTIDDSLLFNTDSPIFSPYAMGAFDFGSGKGWYVETGLRHDFVIEDWGLTLTVKGDVAYIARLQTQFIFTNTEQDTGWQHAEGGLYASYSVNNLLNIPRRYGEFNLTGFVTYSGKLSKQLTASNVLWSGGGLAFRY